MKKRLNTTITVLFTTLALGMTGSAFAKDADPNIASNDTNLSAELTLNIAKTAMAMGVKEPLKLTKEGGNAKVSGGSATVCTVKLSADAAPKMLGISCK